jgi:hypothetical protein
MKTVMVANGQRLAESLYVPLILQRTRIILGVIFLRFGHI